jgi:hypothetical protein
MLRLSLLRLLAFIFCSPFAIGLADQRPNVIILLADDAGSGVEVEAEAEARVESTAQGKEVAKGGCRSFARATATARVDSSGRTVTRHAEEQAEDSAEGCRAAASASATVRGGN